MGWSGKKLTGLAVLIFAGQIGAIFALHTREPLRVKMAPLVPAPIADFPTNSVGTEVDDLNDPLAFAGANERGFSAHAWLKPPKMELSLSNSIAPPSFLAFQRSPGQIPEPNAFDGPAPQLPFVSFALSNEKRRESVVRLQGGIINRPLTTRIVPPIQIGSDTLSNTVVQVAIQADGAAFSARLLESSGSRGADLTALQLARDAQFTPLPPAERKTVALQWGELIFLWASTNPPPTTPK
jgi:TonB family protein